MFTNRHILNRHQDLRGIVLGQAYILYCSIDAVFSGFPGLSYPLLEPPSN